MVFIRECDAFGRAIEPQTISEKYELWNRCLQASKCGTGKWIRNLWRLRCLVFPIVRLAVMTPIWRILPQVL